MIQLDFWKPEPRTVSAPVINVAQIPQRSPFRYPGGKTWLVPHVRKWLRAISPRPSFFIEPFVGGGIVSLTVAFEDLAEHVLMVELDKHVASVWKTLLSDQNAWLAQRVSSFDMTLENLRAELSKKPQSTRMFGFQTLLRNRTYHGGILAPGSGILKYGENGKGIKSRWYPETLRKRIQGIQFVQKKMTFVEGDGIETIQEYASRKDVVFFIDPPYTAAGKRAGSRLYTHCELDHGKLFKECKKIKGDFLMTYDVADEIVTMAEAKGFEVGKVSMMNTHHSTMEELVIGKDLSWMFE